MMVVSESTSQPRFVLTDEYLNSVLPSFGFKIISPLSHSALKESHRIISESPMHSTHPKQFEKYFTEIRSESELPPQIRQRGLSFDCYFKSKMFCLSR
jgi:hypothetical protein